MTNGGAHFDKIFAVNATTGDVLATLDLGQNLDPVAGVFHPLSGHLFVLDQDPNEVVELNPSDGSVLGRFPTPFDIAMGGLAIDPVTGNLWIGSSNANAVAEVSTDGTVLRQVNLEPQSISFEISGLAFTPLGQLVASSNRGVVYGLSLAVSPQLQATVTSIASVAAGGTPLNPSVASANAGQPLELIGTNFNAFTQVHFPIRDNHGNLRTIAVVPNATSDDGTRLQVLVPNLAESGPVRVNNLGRENLGFSSHNDAIHRDVTLRFTATNATTRIRFSDGGLQDVNDESWGLDNVRVIDDSGTPVFTTDFEAGVGPEWSSSALEASSRASFSRFSGRFANQSQALTLPTAAGTEYTLKFDLYVLDSWDGDTTNVGPDFFDVYIDSQRVLHDTFNNVSVDRLQTFGAGSRRERAAANCSHSDRHFWTTGHRRRV